MVGVSTLRVTPISSKRCLLPGITAKSATRTSNARMQTSIVTIFCASVAFRRMLPALTMGSAVMDRAVMAGVKRVHQRGMQEPFASGSKIAPALNCAVYESPPSTRTSASANQLWMNTKSVARAIISRQCTLVPRNNPHAVRAKQG